MAQLSTFSGLTGLTESIPSENLNRVLQGALRPRPVAVERVAWIEDLAPGMGSTHNFLRWDSSSTPAGSKDETDAFSDVALTLSEETATPLYVGGRYPVSREAQHDSAYPVLQEIVREGLDALMTRISSDVLALASSISDTTGSATDTANLNGFQTSLESFRAQNGPGGQIACILHPTAARDLLADIASTSAPFIAAHAMVPGDMANGVFLGQLFGVNLYRSPQLPANGGGTINVFSYEGNGMSALGLVFAERPGLEMEPGDTATRKTDYAVVAARYASTLTGRPATAWTTVT